MFAYPYIGAVSLYLSQTNFRGVQSVTLLIAPFVPQSPVYAVLDALARILLENVHIVIERLMENVHEMVSRIDEEIKERGRIEEWECKERGKRAGGGEVSS